MVQARTYPDLLTSPYDEELFEYYTMSQIVLVSVRQHFPTYQYLHAYQLRPPHKSNPCPTQELY